MTGQEFKDFMQELRFNYELKMPDQDLAKHWFGKLKHLPGECLPWISDRILASQDRFPKRFDSLVCSMYREWLAVNPNKQEPKHICPECDHGWITVMETEQHLYGDRLIPIAYACLVCRPMVNGVKKLTYTQAKRQGMILHESAFSWQQRALPPPEDDNLFGQVAGQFR